MRGWAFTEIFSWKPSNKKPKEQPFSASLDPGWHGWLTRNPCASRHHLILGGRAGSPGIPVLLRTWEDSLLMGLRGKTPQIPSRGWFSTKPLTTDTGSQLHLFQRNVGVVWQSGSMAASAGPGMEQDSASLVPAPVSSLFLFSVVYTLLSQASGCPETGSLPERSYPLWLSLFKSAHLSRYRANKELWASISKWLPTDKSCQRCKCRAHAR